jgi:uncharacterized protein
VLPCDLAAHAQVRQLASDAGEIDVLVANAGLPGRGTLPKLSPEEIDQVLEVNLRAPIMLARLLAPPMVERGRGQLVFVASFAGKIASAGESAIYTASKFGLRGFAHGLRAQMRRKGVGVSLVTPGPISDAGMFARGGPKLPWRRRQERAPRPSTPRGGRRRRRPPRRDCPRSPSPPLSRPFPAGASG